MKTKSLVLSFILVLLLNLVAAAPALAAKPFVAKGGVAKKIVHKTTGFTIPVSAKFRPDRKGLLFNFTNLNGIESVSYSFTYTANGQPQGAGGTVTSDNNPSQQRELLFGTCSTAICTYHGNIKAARLVFTAKLTNGKTAVRSFRIKTNF